MKILDFIGYNPFIRQSRTDKGFKVEFEVSQDQYQKIMELPLLQEKTLKISVELKED